MLLQFPLYRTGHVTVAVLNSHSECGQDFQVARGPSDLLMEITVGHLLCWRDYQGSPEKPSRTSSQQRKRSTALSNVLLSYVSSCFTISETQKKWEFKTLPYKLMEEKSLPFESTMTFLWYRKSLDHECLEYILEKLHHKMPLFLYSSLKYLQLLKKWRWGTRLHGTFFWPKKALLRYAHLLTEVHTFPTTPQSASNCFCTLLVHQYEKHEGDLLPWIN